MEIDFAQYLSDDERKEIIVEEFREYARKQAKEDHERVAINGAYKLVWEYLDQQFDGELEALVKENAKKVICDLSAFSVFRERDAWNSAPSPARRILDDAVKANSELVAERVRKIIKDLSKEDVWDLLAQGEVSFSTGKE